MKTSRYLTNDNLRLFKHLMTYTTVIFFDSFNKFLSEIKLLLLDEIYCVRWKSNGDKLASSSKDGIINVLDFKTGETLFSGKTSDEGK